MYEVVINFLKSATGTAPQLSDWLAMLGVVLTITFGCVGAVQTYFTVLQWLIARRDARNRESILFETAGSGFSARDFDAIRTTYVEPDVSQVDPNGSESERQILSTREAAFSALHRFLKNTAQESKFLLVLADSGAGKTSLLAALVQRLNSRSAFIAGLRGVLIACGAGRVQQRIAEVANKAQIVLCLDAFDEDPLAIADHQTRLADLLNWSDEFAAVLISCRTQFFLHDEEIPKRSGVVIVRPRPAGVAREHLLYKFYLAPFTAAQIDRYVRLTIRNPLRRARARRFVRRMPDLGTRPMLLALVPELIKHRQDVLTLASNFDLYSYMIMMWLKRESEWIASGQLQMFSETLAVSLFTNRAKRGGEFMPRVEFDAFCKVHAPTVENWRLSSRSLLVRTAEGAIKFAHRSILEYFAVCAAFRAARYDARSNQNSYWTDQMRTFALDLLASVDRVTTKTGVATKISDELLSKCDFGWAVDCGFTASAVADHTRAPISPNLAFRYARSWSREDIVVFLVPPRTRHGRASFAADVYLIFVGVGRLPGSRIDKVQRFPRFVKFAVDVLTRLRSTRVSIGSANSMDISLPVRSDFVWLREIARHWVGTPFEMAGLLDRFAPLFERGVTNEERAAAERLEADTPVWPSLPIVGAIPAIKLTFSDWNTAVNFVDRAVLSVDWEWVPTGVIHPDWRWLTRSDLKKLSLLE